VGGTHKEVATAMATTVYRPCGNAKEHLPDMPLPLFQGLQVVCRANTLCELCETDIESHAAAGVMAQVIEMYSPLEVERTGITVNYSSLGQLELKVSALL